MKTPFMWAGSKDRDYKTFKHLIPSFSSYCEPFAGGGAVYFRLLAERGSFAACLADVNLDLMTTYEMLRDQPQALIDGLPATKDKATFKSLMADAPTSKIGQAVRFLYLNRNRFFGMGGWMVADRYARDAVVERIVYFSPLMQETVFKTSCWDVALPADGFVFCDPPYPETNNDACYKLADRHIMQLNVDFLKHVARSPSAFFWITKHSQEIEDLARSLGGLDIERRAWTYRKPGAAVQTAHEIYIRRDPPDELLTFKSA